MRMYPSVLASKSVGAFEVPPTLTLPRVMLANLLLSTASFAIVAAPPAAIETSDDTLPKIESSKLLKVTFFSVPASENTKLSPCAIVAPPRAENESMSSDVPGKFVNPEPSPENDAVTVLRWASLPETITFFQFAIIFSLFVLTL